MSKNVNTAAIVEFMREDKKPSNCLGCGNCTTICPQKINIPFVMKELTELTEKMPKWKDISKIREQESKQFK